MIRATLVEPDDLALEVPCPACQPPGDPNCPQCRGSGWIVTPLGQAVLEFLRRHGALPKQP